MEDVTDKQLLDYVEHLKAYRHDMHARFKDLLELEVSPWIEEPFATSMPESECDPIMQEHFTEMQSDEKDYAIFKPDKMADFCIKCSGSFANGERK